MQSSEYWSAVSVGLSVHEGRSKTWCGFLYSELAGLTFGLFPYRGELGFVRDILPRLHSLMYNVIMQGGVVPLAVLQFHT